MESREKVFDSIQMNHLKELKKELEQHPELLEIRDFSGETPLIRAAVMQKNDIVEYLLEKRADVNAVSNSGSNAFLCSIYDGDMALAEKLIQSGFDFNRKNRNEYIIIDILKNWLHEDKRTEQLHLLGKCEHLMNDEVKKEFKKCRLRALLS